MNILTLKEILVLKNFISYSFIANTRILSSMVYKNTMKLIYETKQSIYEFI